MSLNKKMVVPSGKFNILISGYSFSLCVGINESCKYFIAALVQTIYFNFRLDIDITNLNDMDKFVPLTKHMKGRESKIHHSMKKNSKK